MISVEATEVIRPPLIHSMGQLFGHRLSHDVGRTEAQQFRLRRASSSPHATIAVAKRREWRQLANEVDGEVDWSDISACEGDGKYTGAKETSVWVSSLLLLRNERGGPICSVPAHGWHPCWPHETADKHILARIITMETIDHESSLSQTPLETVWCQSTTDPTDSTPPAPVPFRPSVPAGTVNQTAKVMIVDDEPVNVKVVQKHLSWPGINTL